MTDRLITADASKISGRDFLDAVFPLRTPEEQAERVRLAREHQNAVQASFKLPLAEGFDERTRLNVEFDALVKAGKTEVMFLPSGLTPSAEQLSDPLLKHERRAA